MSGTEYLKTLKRIDDNERETTAQVGSELLAYIENYEDEFVEQLQRHQIARVPTSIGDIEVTLRDLEDALARQMIAA